jgi:hypothetical protein
VTRRSPAELRTLRQQLVELRASRAGLGEEIASALDRLDRDLLPRTAGGHEHLVAGIVGPNNAGKSALFNSLVAGALSEGSAPPAKISPSLPTGGATRRLVGALSGELRSALESEPALQRFPMRGVTPGPEGVTAATETAEASEVAELLLVETKTLPETLLLVDTPDFDSVLVENRAVTDALLAVTDVAIVVVTRHTYQNHDVIQFLSDWLGHGRPWVLVYNESIDAKTTLKHAEKIAADLGGEPEAVFHAPFDLEVARGERALVPILLSKGTEGSVAMGTWLRELGASGDLKARALEASFEGLDQDLRVLAAGARTLLAKVDGVTALAEDHATRLAQAVAREAMPMGPFLAAFREVLDERPTAVQRELRRGLRWTSHQVVGTAKWIGGKVRGGAPKEVASEDARAVTLFNAEGAELEAGWSAFIEPLQVELRAVRRSSDTPEEVRAALADVTAAGAAPLSLEAARETLQLDPNLMREYQAACREIIAAELDEHGTEWALQLAVDALHLLPLGVAGAVIVHTGGVGVDLAVAGGGALSAAAAERLSRTLGTGVAAAARRRWVELRTPKITKAVVDALLRTPSGSHGQSRPLTALKDEAQRIVQAASLPGPERT